MHNVEKSKFQKGMYVGYGGGAVWHIRNYGKGNWKATPQGNNKHQVFSCATLRDVSTQLETLNALKTDPQTGKRQNNPAKRQAFPNVATATRALKQAEKALADNPNMWPGAAAGFKTVITKANKYLAENSQTHKTNPAPRKRAISRPSQVTKKAPSKRLVSRRKAAAKKPVKGYFPNPVAITAPGPSRKTHEDLPHLFPQPGGAYMISFWRESTKKWVPATLEYSITAAKKWLEYQGYKKAVLLK